MQEGLRTELQGQMQWLVANYASRRSGLLEEILPEVGVRVVQCLSCCTVLVVQVCGGGGS